MYNLCNNYTLAMENLNNLFAGLNTSLLFTFQQNGSSRPIYGVANLKTFGRNATVQLQILHNNVMSNNFRTSVVNSILTKFCLYTRKCGMLPEEICVN
jgi:hypothetical protein